MNENLPKALRVHTHDTVAQDDWFLSKLYENTEINAIQDPTDATDLYHITSIPSPFARIDIVKTAFQQLNDMVKGDDKNASGLLDKLDGKTIFHKMVSECFDVGELFFNQRKYSEIRIIRWKRDPEGRTEINDDFLKQLNDSSRYEHKLLGRSLDLYLQQDSRAYNFGQMNELSILLLNNKVIGGTSPATVFFSSADAKEHAEDSKIRIGGDILFDDIYNPLFKRDIEFQKYLFYMFKAYPDLIDKMGEFYVYLENTYKKLYYHNRPFYDEISKFLEKSASEAIGIYEDYTEGTGTSLLKNIDLRRSKLSKEKIQDFSDFVIQSTKYKSGSLPLVLQNEFKGIGYKYAKGLWEEKFTVPFLDSRPLEERTLPIESDPYPYLTVSDFLSSTLYSVPYKLNTDNFFTGENSVGQKESYLLPLKELFFRFFSIDELVSNKMLTFNIQNRNSVDVILRVPIKRNYVEFRRTYILGSKPELSKNIGQIETFYFSLASMPFIKYTSTNSVPPLPDTRLLLIENKVGNKNTLCELKFFESNSKKQFELDKDKHSIHDRSLVTEAISHRIYKLKTDYDYLSINTKQYYSEGSYNEELEFVILPNFKQITETGTSYTFAVDFGTSTTHIEYRVNDIGDPIAFNIVDDKQLVTFHDPKEVTTNFPEIQMGNLIRFMIPEVVKKDTDYSFPIRSALSLLSSFPDTTIPTTFADINIPFTFEKKPSIETHKILTNLKWESGRKAGNSESNIKSYLSCLAMLMRNKVITNGGKLSDTQIVWTYPFSMESSRISNLESFWADIYYEYFGKVSDGNSLIKRSESLAPFYFYNSKKLADSSYRPVVSIDIGGGTVDVVSYFNNEPALSTSFKFGANYLYGEGTSGRNYDNSGFVKLIEPHFRTIFTSANISDLLKVMDENKSRPSFDFISFLYSLEDNPLLKSMGLKGISLNTFFRQNDDFKIVFLLYISSIIYHVAKIMKVQDLDSPAQIIFSGNGAKTLDIIDNSPSKVNLAKLAKLMFTRIIGKSEDITIRTEKKPKEITAKGALLSETDKDLNEIFTILMGTKENEISPKRKQSNYVVTSISTKYLLDEKNFPAEVVTFMQKNLLGKEFASANALEQAILASPSGHLIMGREQELREATIESFSRAGFTLNNNSMAQPEVKKLPFEVRMALMTSAPVETGKTFPSESELENFIESVLSKVPEYERTTHLKVLKENTVEEMRKRGFVGGVVSEPFIKYSKVVGYNFDSVVQEVGEFWNVLIEINDELSFKKTFTVKHADMKTYRVPFSRNLKQHLMSGYQEKLQDVGNPNEKINETLFFYPIIGGLNDLVASLPL